MAYQLIAHTGKGSTLGAAITTDAIDTTGANLLVAAVCYGVGQGNTTLASDSKGNTWTALTDNFANTKGCRFYYCFNPTVGSGHTFTSGGSGGFPSLVVGAWSGGSAFDKETTNSHASTATLSAGSITPAEDDELLIAVAAINGGTVNSINSDYQITDAVAFQASNHYGGAMAYKIQTTAAASNPTFTLSGVTAITTAHAAFKASQATAFNSLISMDV